MPPPNSRTPSLRPEKAHNIHDPGVELAWEASRPVPTALSCDPTILWVDSRAKQSTQTCSTTKHSPVLFSNSPERCPPQLSLLPLPPFYPDPIPPQGCSLPLQPHKISTLPDSASTSQISSPNLCSFQHPVFLKSLPLSAFSNLLSFLSQLLLYQPPTPGSQEGHPTLAAMTATSFCLSWLPPCCSEPLLTT